jgi:hypothetical protein
MGAYNRLKSFAHWIKLEKDPGEDRMLHASDIDCILAVVDAARNEALFWNEELCNRKECEQLYDARDALEKALKNIRSEAEMNPPNRPCPSCHKKDTLELCSRWKVSLTEDKKLYDYWQCSWCRYIP